jgi:hypothetical protein
MLCVRIQSHAPRSNCSRFELPPFDAEDVAPEPSGFAQSARTALCDRVTGSKCTTAGKVAPGRLKFGVANIVRFALRPEAIFALVAFNSFARF